MTLADWLVVTLLCLVSLAVGLVLTRRAGREGASGYFTGNRGRRSIIHVYYSSQDE